MRSLLTAVAALLIATGARSEAVELGSVWHGLAAVDSAAALGLIARDHPGAAPELGDGDFQARLSTARAHVRERMPLVKTYQGYAALMAGLAADFGDGHIWSSAIVGAQRVTTAGILLGRREGRWIVQVQTPLQGEPDLVGATFLGCDGKDADSWAFPRIASFRGDPQLEAVRANAASWLLLDEGNPFLVRPATCRFAPRGGIPVDVPMRWRLTLMRRVQSALDGAAKAATAGMRVEPFPGGWWIGLETLGPPAQRVVDLVAAKRSALRAAPLVVVDLRGNGGGDSNYADAVARLLVGEVRFAAAQPTPSECSGEYWRATPETLGALRDDLERLGPGGDAETIAELRAVVADMETAVATHRRFSPALPKCARIAAPIDQSAEPKSLPPSAMAGRLVLLTDHACFSSCLIAANLLRRLGALHVGEVTDRSSRYMEVREETLPSGLRSFSTLQKVAVGLGDFGPYRPSIPFPGDISDDAALRAWIPEVAGVAGR